MMRTTSDRWRRPVAAVALMLAAGGAVAIAALDDGPLSGPERYDSGQFVFARVRYADAYIVPGYYNGQNQPGWAHDYPGAESYLMRILESVTFLNPYIGGNGGVIVDLDDPDLFKYPFAYMSEPGYWNVTEREAEGLRNYLLKGGFLIFDDQRSDEHWNNLEAQMRRVLPGLRWVQLDASHPVYHSFFDIETLEQYEQAYPGYDPIFYGLFWYVGILDESPVGKFFSKEERRGGQFEEEIRAQARANVEAQFGAGASPVPDQRGHDGHEQHGTQDE